jgi:nucleoside phosphorylase
MRRTDLDGFRSHTAMPAEATVNTEGVDILIVTALQLEHRAIRAHLRDVRTENVTGLAADIGWHEGGIRGIRRRVAVIETGAGNIDAAIMTARAEGAFRPSMVAMVGIAGGVKDVAVGDVVASSKVYWVEGGRQGSVLNPRPEIAAVSPALVQAARAVAADDEWFTRGAGAGGTWPGAGRRPAALVAPIVVAEKVLTDRGCDLAVLIRDSYGDAVAVDTEDFGALRAARSTERARVIAVRGISDLLTDKAAADSCGSQQLAAANAAAFLFEILSRVGSRNDHHDGPVPRRLPQVPLRSTEFSQAASRSGGRGRRSRSGTIRTVRIRRCHRIRR